MKIARQEAQAETLVFQGELFSQRALGSPSNRPRLSVPGQDVRFV